MRTSELSRLTGLRAWLFFINVSTVDVPYVAGNCVTSTSAPTSRYYLFAKNSGAIYFAILWNIAQLRQLRRCILQMTLSNFRSSKGISFEISLLRREHLFARCGLWISNVCSAVQRCTINATSLINWQSKLKLTLELQYSLQGIRTA